MKLSVPMSNPPRRVMRILVVDDHESLAQALARLLRHEGHVVTTANTFASALALGTGPDPPDTLVCDIDLPDGDGCDLLRRLVAVRGDRALPAIAVTGFSEDWVERCRMAGYRQLLTKPFQFAEILKAINALGDHQPRGLGGVPTPIPC